MAAPEDTLHHAIIAYKANSPAADLVMRSASKVIMRAELEARAGRVRLTRFPKAGAIMASIVYLVTCW